MRDIGNNPSTPNETVHNVGSNVATSASASTTAAECGQTTGTWKQLSYSKQSLIEEQSIFWLDRGERVPGEVASVF